MEQDLKQGSERRDIQTSVFPLTECEEGEQRTLSVRVLRPTPFLPSPRPLPPHSFARSALPRSRLPCPSQRLPNLCFPA